MLNNLNRREFFVGTIAASLMLSRPAAALTEAGAKQLVDSVVSEVERVVTSGKSDSAVLRELEKLFVRYADVNIMAQYALGVDGRSASAAQKRAFSDAFTGYIARKYGKQFRDFIGGRVEVQSTRQIKAGYEVKTLAYLQGDGPFDVTFHVSDKSGRDKFFNIYIEGVNLLLTERTEIGAMLDKRGGDINAMIADLKSAG
ncbi:ABC transporter substrate-binding protein [Roseobacter sp. YSTF-M11]|uniref:ABC transporter substrate-binding protein n=1 Tax=Roseobacter insulae TaxID=2859783 RepID=A0A9X1FWQ5_9RHOB|nr:ABC transporter substrate-binding protein [Roseobacter insulae]MBW4709460.1 ABC transporter substrate-binding protein [Roseobacter insulae]